MEVKSLADISNDIDCAVAWLEEGITALDAVQQELSYDYDPSAENREEEKWKAVVLYRQVPAYLAQFGVIARDLRRQMEDISHAAEDLFALHNKTKEVKTV